MTEDKDREAKIPFELTDTDRENLEAGDAKFWPHNWEDLKKIIAENNLSILKRKPSDLRRYITWTNQIKAEFGSIISYVCSQRLFWNPLPSSSPESGPLFAFNNPVPYSAPNDYRILLNDWPYGISPEISHIIVWSKVRLPVQQPDGYLTPESTALVKDFVQQTFTDRLVRIGRSSDDVLWFRNWTGLQSVRGLEHVHVLVRNAPKELLDGWINGKIENASTA